MRVLALCTQIDDLALGAFRDREVCKKYPGSGWMPLVSETAGDDVTVCSGHEAINLLLSHRVKAADILVVQEQLNGDAKTLIAAGAIPHIVYSLESPLYDPTFYDVLPDLCPLFPRQICFGTAGTDRVYFPSFDASRDLRQIDPESWHLRPKTLAAVMANKHYSQYPAYPNSFHYRHALEYQLHDQRAKIISKLKDDQKVLDLSGKGWNPPAEIPPGEKVQFLSEYKYALCMENMAMPGYVTEKIIDAMVAGCVPIYLGDPTIDESIPKDCFVEAKGDFSEWHAFAKWCEKEGPSLVDQGQRFLRSPEGHRFSYQHFASEILKGL